MFSTKIATLLVILLVAEAIHLQGNHEASVDLPAGTVNLIADNGQAIKVCNNCGAAAYTDSASVADYSASNNDEVWTLEVVGSQVAFKGSNGKYLSRCNNCWNSAAYPDAAFVHTPDYQSWSLWTPVLNANGKYSFRSDNGKYLAKCNNCAYQGNTPNFAFVHEANPDNSWAQWDVTYTNLPKLGTYTFQAENGQFLKLCSSCGGSYPSAASV
jgi:Zn-finger protein